MRLRSSSRKQPIIRLVTIPTPGVPNTARGHAGVAGFDHHRDALRLEVVPDAVGDLCGQPLLDLQAAGEAVEHAGELGDSDDAVGRQIGDRGLADDRRHMMFAVRLERNVLEQHELVVAADLLEHPAQVDRGILAIAEAVFLPRPRHALGRIEQAFAFGIVAGPVDQRPDRFLHFEGHGRLAALDVFIRPYETAHLSIS